MSETPSYKVVLLGDTGVGKTTILKRFTEDLFDDQTSPTVSPACAQHQFRTPRGPINVNFWDTAGQERFQGMATIYVRSALGAILVFELTSKKSFKNLEKWWDLCQSSAPSPELIFVVGNKSDLDDREVTRGEGEAWAKSHDAGYAEVSGMTGDAIADLFNMIAIAIGKHVFAANEPVNVRINEHEKPKNKCC